MIKGATQLIGGIPGRYLDPFHLASSQPEGFCGYICIGYATAERVWDLLFLQGRAVAEAARVVECTPGEGGKPDGRPERRAVEPGEVEERFGTSALRERSRVYLFEGTKLQLEPFCRTLRSTPALKVQVDPLSREQIVRLIRNLNAPRLIAERALFLGALPLFEFLELKSPHQPIEFQMRFRKGMLLLYTPDGALESGTQLGLALDGAPAGESPPEEGAKRLLIAICRKFSEAISGVLGRGELVPPGAEEEVFARIPEVVRSASAFRRPRIRRKALAMLGELYNEKYEELKEARLLGRVETCYRELKR